MDFCGGVRESPPACGRNKVRRTQRDLTVSRSCSGARESRRISVSGGGSSRVFRKELVASTVRRSASLRMMIFFAPSLLENCTWRITSRTGSILIRRIFDSGSSTIAPCFRKSSKVATPRQPFTRQAVPMATACRSAISGPLTKNAWASRSFSCAWRISARACSGANAMA